MEAIKLLVAKMVEIILANMSGFSLRLLLTKISVMLGKRVESAGTPCVLRRMII